MRYRYKSWEHIDHGFFYVTRAEAMRLTADEYAAGKHATRLPRMGLERAVPLDRIPVDKLPEGMRENILEAWLTRTFIIDGAGQKREVWAVMLRWRSDDCEGYT